MTTFIWALQICGVALAVLLCLFLILFWWAFRRPLPDSQPPPRKSYYSSEGMTGLD